jgi:23S rRNA (pseudouridine1915-N3)-methyltransferase
MKIIVAISSKSLSDPLLIEGIDYLKKTRPPIDTQPLFVTPKSNVCEKEKRVKLESLELLQRTKGFMRIALTEGGTYFSSIQFASFLEKLTNHTSKSAFIIGGAFGLSKELIENCDRTLSLSPMTLPHKMAFLLLCEQLYRAGEIIQKSPYHK